MEKVKITGYLKTITRLNDPDKKHGWKCLLNNFYLVWHTREEVFGLHKFEEWRCNGCRAEKTITRYDISMKDGEI